jgi:hypothetical protein
MLKLSTKEYWEKKFNNKMTPRDHDLTMYHNYRFDKLLKKYLPKDKDWSILEVGASHSSWLIYWFKEFGYKPYGVEYTNSGAVSGQFNLDYFKTNGKIFENDFFNKNAEFRKQKYNVIFSYGFVEHFDKPDEILEASYDLLEDDGYIVTIVPNICGLFGLLRKINSYENYKIHKIVGPLEYSRSYKDLKGEHLYNDYFGTFYLHSVGWKSRISKKIVYFLHKIITKILIYFNIEIEHKLFSPYAINIFKKSDYEDNN